jgi:hypothetical protein
MTGPHLKLKLFATICRILIISRMAAPCNYLDPVNQEGFVVLLAAPHYVSSLITESMDFHTTFVFVTLV